MREIERADVLRGWCSSRDLCQRAIAFIYVRDCPCIRIASHTTDLLNSEKEDKLATTVMTWSSEQAR